MVAAGLTALALFQTWTGLWRLNPDAVSYLDIADAYARRDWGAAFPAHWSPMLPLSLSLARLIGGTSGTTEILLAHAVNLLWFMIAGAGALFFCRELLASNEPVGGRNEGGAWWFFSFGLIAWSSFCLLTLWIVSPDYGVMAVFFAQCGVLLRLRRGNSRLLWVVLGLLGAVSFYVKTSGLPISIVILVGALVFRRSLASLKGFGIALTLMAVLVLPLGLMLSQRAHRFTLGDSGRLNAAWYVHHTDLWAHWHPESEEFGLPEHPERVLSTDPPVYEFSSPFVHSTYPPWYDPSYWHEGLRLKLTPRLFVHRAQETLLSARCAEGQRCEEENLAEILASIFPELILLALLLLITRPPRSEWLRIAPLITVSMAGITMYAMVLMKARYIAPFLAVFFLAVASALVRTPRTRFRNAILILLGAILLSRVGARFYEDYQRRDVFIDPRAFIAGAEDLNMRPGSRVAFVGNGLLDATGWARAARFRVVVDVAPELPEAFWRAPSSTQERIEQVLRREGVDYLITCNLRMNSLHWRRIDDTVCFADSLRASGP